MKAIFVELPPFERMRASYLTDEAYRALQNELMQNPLAGNVIEGTGGSKEASFGSLLCMTKTRLMI